NPLEYGLIAEQVAKVDRNLVVYGAGGRPFSVAYQELPVLLLAGLRDEQRQLSAQRRQLAAQRRELTRLQSQASRLDRLQREVSMLLRSKGGR
ncbi:MAG: hypothetical protein ACYC0H_21535, partial [Solirubrobacteraceae bacterium]